jgi:hypothetical protein
MSMTPDIPNWSFWEVLFGTFLIFSDFIIFCFFAAFFQVFIFRGDE